MVSPEVRKAAVPRATDSYASCCSRRTTIDLNARPTASFAAQQPTRCCGIAGQPDEESRNFDISKCRPLRRLAYLAACRCCRIQPTGVFQATLKRCQPRNKRKPNSCSFVTKGRLPDDR